MENNIISCTKCGIVFNVEDCVIQLAMLGFDNLGEKALNLKHRVYSNWVDLEQTEEEYYKFCPICNSWERFKPFKFKVVAE